MAFDPFADEQKPAAFDPFADDATVAKPEQGDFVRGVSNYIPQMNEMLGAGQALAGEGIRRTLGQGPVGDYLRGAGLSRIDRAQAARVSKPTDSLSTAWETGGVGAVAGDWLPYQMGQSVGNIGEAAVAAGVGGLIGSAVGPEGTVGGAVAGAVGKGIVRKLAVEKAKAIGRNAGLGAMAAFHGVGETGTTAIDENGLSGVDFSRLAPAAVGHAGLEFIGDKLMLSAFKGGKGAMSGVAPTMLDGVKTVAKAIGVQGAKEAPVEVGQTALERFGAGKPIDTAEAGKEYLDAAGAAFGMGVIPGGTGGVRTHSQERTYATAIGKAQDTLADQNAPLEQRAQALEFLKVWKDNNHDAAVVTPWYQSVQEGLVQDQMAREREEALAGIAPIDLLQANQGYAGLSLHNEKGDGAQIPLKGETQTPTLRGLDDPRAVTPVTSDEPTTPTPFQYAGVPPNNANGYGSLIPRKPTASVDLLQSKQVVPQVAPTPTEQGVSDVTQAAQTQQTETQGQEQQPTAVVTERDLREQATRQAFKDDVAVTQAIDRATAENATQADQDAATQAITAAYARNPEIKKNAFDILQSLRTQTETQGQEQQPPAVVTPAPASKSPTIPKNATAGYQGALFGKGARYDRSKEGVTETDPVAVDHTNQLTLDLQQTKAPTPAEIEEATATNISPDTSAARLAAPGVQHELVTPEGRIAFLQAVNGVLTEDEKDAIKVHLGGRFTDEVTPEKMMHLHNLLIADWKNKHGGEPDAKAMATIGKQLAALTDRSGASEDVTKSSLRASALQLGVSHQTVSNRTSAALGKIQRIIDEHQLHEQDAQELLGIRPEVASDHLSMISDAEAAQMGLRTRGKSTGARANLAESDDFDHSNGFSRDEETLNDGEKATVDVDSATDSALADVAAEATQIDNPLAYMQHAKDSNGDTISEATVAEAVAEWNAREDAPLHEQWKGAWVQYFVANNNGVLNDNQFQQGYVELAQLNESTEPASAEHGGDDARAEVSSGVRVDSRAPSETTSGLREVSAEQKPATKVAVKKKRSSKPTVDIGGTTWDKALHDEAEAAWNTGVSAPQEVARWSGLSDVQKYSLLTALKEGNDDAQSQAVNRTLRELNDTAEDGVRFSEKESTNGQHLYDESVQGSTGQRDIQSVPGLGSDEESAAAERSWIEKKFDSPWFKRWFGKSKLTVNGQPRLVYHGRVNPLRGNAFDFSKLGQRTGASTSGLGWFFAPEQSGAKIYADNPTTGQQGPVYEGYLRLENPYEMTPAEFSAMARKSVAENTAYRNELEALGHDGIILQDLNKKDAAYVVFDGNQFKDDSGVGTFDDTSDIYFSEDQGTKSEAKTIATALKKAFFSPEKFNRTVAIVQSIADLPAVAKQSLSQAKDPSKVQAFVGNDGKVYMIADNITPGQEMSVFLHEVGVHLGMEKLIGKVNMAQLHKQITAWAAKNDGSQESILAKAALARAENSSSNDKVEEVLAYFVEEAVNAGVNPTAMQQASGELQKWFNLLLTAMKVALSKIGMQRFNQLSAKNLVDLAYGAAKLELGEGAVSADKTAFSEAPAAVRNTASTIGGAAGEQFVDNTWHGLAKMAYSLAPLHDLVEEFKGKIPAIKDWYKAVQKSVSARRQLEADAELIANDANNLKNGTEAVNEFISRSTFEQKWGYDPKIAGQTVVVDPDMARAFNALTPEEQRVAKAVFAHGETMNAAKFEILKALGINNVFTRTGSINGPYAPLKRFGNYLGVLKSKELVAAEKDKEANKALIAKLKESPDHYIVSSFDTIGQAKQFAQANADKYALTDAYEKSTRVGEDRVMPPDVLQKVLAAVKMDANIPANARAAMADLVRDMYFQAFDEHNARTSGMKRLNRAGYDADMIRSFLSHARAEAGFLANMKHGGEINEQFYKMQNGVKGDSGAKVHQDAFNAIAAHYAENLKHVDTPWQDRAMALTSAWQLATSVGYHVTNALQGLMVTIPKLGADFGNYSGAWKHLLAGYGTLKHTGLWGNIDLSKVQDKNLRAALQTAADEGVLDVGMDEDLTHMEATRTGFTTVDTASKKARGALHLLRKVSRAVETANRVSAAVAGYNMYIERGKSEPGKLIEEAQDYAVGILRTTQGDFSRIGAPLLLKRLPKVMTQYKKYQFMMGALYVGAFRQAFMGADAPTRAIGRRMLAYKLFHTSMAAGVLGMPLMNLAALAFAGLGGGDEPEDLERYLKESGMPDWMLHGVPTLAGVDMSGKLGDDKIFSIIPYGTFDVSSAAGMTKTLAGIAGPAFAQGGKFADGIGMMQKGEYYKGLEKFMPKGVESGMKAFRIANEGFSLKNGDVMFKPGDVDGFALTLDSLGLPSTELRKMEYIRSQQYKIGQFYNTRTTEIEQDYAKAFKAKDAATMTELRQDWLDLQRGKANMRKYFGDSNKELKASPLSNLIKYPHTVAKREVKLQRSIPANM